MAFFIYLPFCTKFWTRCTIELLKEMSTPLIAEVVTGKLDVREAADQLP